jgi:hypothetical protein
VRARRPSPGGAGRGTTPNWILGWEPPPTLSKIILGVRMRRGASRIREVGGSVGQSDGQSVVDVYIWACSHGNGGELMCITSWGI